MAVDLNAVATFVAVARARGFGAAALRLGVTRSAVSQSIRKLEDGLGIALLRRTTRSVSLTEAGERFYDSVSAALGDIRVAVEATGDLREQPSGLLRLAVSSIAENFLSGPLLASFLEAHPAIRLDIVVTDDEFDIVAEGFDAGVRLNEVIEKDMIAVPVSGGQRQVVVASPPISRASASPRIRATCPATGASAGAGRPASRPTVGSSASTAANTAWRSSPRSPPTTWD